MEIPAILSGPIVRRVEPTSVYIWLATSKNFDLNATFYHIIFNDKSSPKYELIDTFSEVNTIQAGENMYFHLVKINPVKKTFPTDTLIGYNLYLKYNNNQFDLSSFNLLNPDNSASIVYGNLSYPTFSIQEKNSCNILYGSCRKAHGEGESSFVSVDHAIEKNHIDVKNRPNNLFLMGDQIYADDVADPLFHMINSWSKTLMGDKYEDLSDTDERLTKQSFQSAIDQIHGRQFIMEHFCHFTSRNAANHMMRFSEYAVHYLLAFGPSLWSDLSTFEQLMIDDKFYFMYPNGPSFHHQRAEEYENHEFRYHVQTKKLQKFIQTLPHVRRVLANIPTYMIFDDHDITDDWNISAEWRSQVYGEPLGREVISNGLEA